MARTNQRSPITRSAYAIRSPPQRDEVFGTHSVLMRIKPPGVPHGCCLRFSRDEGSLSGRSSAPGGRAGQNKKARQWRTGGVVRNEKLRLDSVSLGSRPQVPSAQTRQSGRCCRQEGRCASRARFGNAKRKTRGRKGADDGARSCVTCRAVILGPTAGSHPAPALRESAGEKSRPGHALLILVSISLSVVRASSRILTSPPLEIGILRLQPCPRLAAHVA